MELQKIFEGKNGQERQVDDLIADLKRFKEPLHIPKWSELQKEYNAKLHRIKTDQEFWKDKGSKKKPRKVSRITYGLQKLATNRMTQMAFAIPVRRIYGGFDKKDEESKKVVAALEAIYSRVHIDSLNRKRMKSYFAACELLTIWYAVEGNEEHKDYGFDTKYKLRCKSYSPMKGYDLYPIFDEYDDMLGMCIEYKEKKYEDGVQQEVLNFEIFIPGRHVRYTSDGNKWTQAIDEKVKIVKLPLAYMYRETPIWEDQTGNCDEIELALSRESEILRHNSAPYLKVAGQIQSGVGQQANDPKGQAVVKKKPNEDDSDDATRIVKVENGGDVEYVTWQQSVEAMKYFVSELKKNAEEELQLPNLSMENVKGIAAMSGEARKTLLTDPHLKVGEEAGEIVMFLEREWKVICAFLSLMNPSWAAKIKALKCEHVVTPFIQNDEKADIDKWRSAAGGEPVVSQKTAIKYSGLVDDPESEYEEILKEQHERAKSQSLPEMFPTTE